jgi:excisionase family DNA binding protein
MCYLQINDLYLTLGTKAHFDCFVCFVYFVCGNIGAPHTERFGSSFMGTESLRSNAPSLPTEKEVKLAKESGRLLAACIGRGETARLRVIDGEKEIDVPISALRMLEQILAQMAMGNGVTIIPVHAVLTTQEAADFLNVSRPFLVALVERGELAFTKVGTHRRIQFKDLLEYRNRTLANSKKALNELAADAQEFGMGY